MPATPGRRPTPAELEILRVFWRLGRSRVQFVHRELNLKRSISITAVSTTIGLMADKGLLRKFDDIRPQEFEAIVTEEQVGRSLVADVRDRVFGGSLRALVKHALRGAKATDAELDELRRLIEESRKKK